MFSPLDQDGQREPHAVERMTRQHVMRPSEEFRQHQAVSRSDVPDPARGWVCVGRLVPHQQGGLALLCYDQPIDFVVSEVVVGPLLLGPLPEPLPGLRLAEMQIKTRTCSQKIISRQWLGLNKKFF